MHIVVIGTRGFPNVQGGVEKHCEQLYPRMIEAGSGEQGAGSKERGAGSNNDCNSMLHAPCSELQITVLTRKPYVDLSVTEWRGVKLVPVDCPKHKFLEAFVHSFKAVFKAKELKADLLHVHAVGPSLVVPLARLLGLKVVITHHGPDYERKKWNMIAKMVLMTGEACGCLFANRIITIAGYLARHIHRKFGRDAVVIPNGVNIQVNGQRSTVNGDEVLGKFGLEPGKYFVAVGRFVPEKGFHDLVDAFVKVTDTGHTTQDTRDAESGSDWKLVIVGDADHEDDYSRSLKEKARGVDGVVLTGFQSGDALESLYAHAGVFVLPSWYEGLPIVLLEAMSYGLNCIVSDIPANREVPLEERRFFKPGDIEAMAQKLAEAAARPLTEEERAAQLDLIAREYSWDVIARRTVEVYQTVILTNEVREDIPVI